VIFTGVAFDIVFAVGERFFTISTNFWRVSSDASESILKLIWMLSYPSRTLSSRFKNPWWSWTGSNMGKRKSNWDVKWSRIFHCGYKTTSTWSHKLLLYCKI